MELNLNVILLNRINLLVNNFLKFLNYISDGAQITRYDP